MRSIFTIIFSAAVLGAGGVYAAEAEDDAKAKVDRAWVERRAQTCAACHGQKGAAPIADYPTIAGQYKSYLVHALKAYRDGERENPVMSAQARGLMDAQIEALAGYYARQDSPLHVPALKR